jgi:cobalt/nickel transport system ATP-binding protein
MSLIELNEIRYTYPDEHEPTLQGLTLKAEAGECLLIAGENGAGKTTLFRILNGLAFPDRGEYLFDGTPITREYLKDNHNSKLFHKRIGYLFQNPDIMLFNGRVRDEIAFGPRQMGLPDAEVEQRTRDCMELFGLTGLEDKAPYHLSGGQKKRVAIAAVMALNPEVLILDEPFAGIDEKIREESTRFLAELKESGKTLLIATHDEEPVKQLTDRRLELVGGRFSG